MAQKWSDFNSEDLPKIEKEAISSSASGFRSDATSIGDKEVKKPAILFWLKVWLIGHVMIRIGNYALYSQFEYGTKFAAPQTGFEGMLIAGIALELVIFLAVLWASALRSTKARFITAAIVLFGYVGSFLLHLSSSVLKPVTNEAPFLVSTGGGALPLALFFALFLIFSKKTKAYYEAIAKQPFM